MLYLVHKIKLQETKIGLEEFAVVKPISDPQELIVLPMINEDDFSSKEFECALNDIKEYTFPSGIKNADGGKIPLGTSLVAMKFNNKKFFLLIPSTQIEPGMIEILPMHTNVTKSEFTTNYELESAGDVYCTGCDGKCMLKTKSLGQVKYCDGCNSGCTIHF